MAASWQYPVFVESGSIEFPEANPHPALPSTPDAEHPTTEKIKQSQTWLTQAMFNTKNAFVLANQSIKSANLVANPSMSHHSSGVFADINVKNATSKVSLPYPEYSEDQQELIDSVIEHKISQEQINLILQIIDPVIWEQRQIRAVSQDFFGLVFTDKLLASADDFDEFIEQQISHMWIKFNDKINHRTLLWASLSFHLTMPQETESIELSREHLRSSLRAAFPSMPGGIFSPLNPTAAELPRVHGLLEGLTLPMLDEPASG